MFKLLFNLIAFVREATTYIEPDEEALESAGISKDRYVKCHRRVVNITRIIAFLGCGCGIAGVVAIFARGEPIEFKKVSEMVALIISPILFPLFGFVIGCVIGVAFACLFAPADFLRGPLGRKWTSFIGTDNIIVLRIVCFIFGVIPLFFFFVVIGRLLWQTFMVR